MTKDPTDSQASISTYGSGVPAMTKDPIAKTTSARREALLRPYASFIYPPAADPIIAPTKAILTIVSCKRLLFSTAQNRQGCTKAHQI